MLMCYIEFVSSQRFTKNLQYVRRLALPLFLTSSVFFDKLGVNKPCLRQTKTAFLNLRLQVFQRSTRSAPCEWVFPSTEHNSSIATSNTIVCPMPSHTPNWISSEKVDNR